MRGRAPVGLVSIAVSLVIGRAAAAVVSVGMPTVNPLVR